MKKSSKIFRVLIVTMLLTALMGTQVLAAENDVQAIPVLEAFVYEYTTENGISARGTVFNTATIAIAFDPSYGMYIGILTHLNGIGSVVGVKDILIQEKQGNAWVTVATSAGGEVTNAAGIGCELYYPGAQSDKFYRVICTHYGDYEGYRELYHESEAFRCIYNTTK